MSLKQVFLALLLGSVLVQTGLRCAKAEPAYEVRLEDEFGNELPAYAHRGDVFAMGREGQRYNVRLVNHTGQRVEAVVSVDGRDVLSGDPGDYKHQRGYVVPAYGSVLIDGFRQSLSEVAAFRFSHPDDSYSSRMGTPENVGVIGAAFFSEARRPTSRPHVARESAPRAEAPRSSRKTESSSRDRGYGGAADDARPSSAPSAERAPSPGSAQGRSRSSAEAWHDHEDESASNIGTEYGETRYSAVNEVSFKRARPTSPDRVVTLRYDDREGLIARGILPRPRPQAPSGPSAFPANRRFAPPPPPVSYWN